jgi:SHAQKYF class myb-like DNA-binding protein
MHIFIIYLLALKLYGKDWKKVEDFIATRSGAQIRSHAQKYFLRLTKNVDLNEEKSNSESKDICMTTKGLELFRKSLQNEDHVTSNQCFN